MSSTISLNELEKISDNIYEAIVIIAKRARQINEEQKALVEVEPEIEEMDENYDEGEETEEQELVERKVIKLPKPTELAIQEMLSGKVKWDYGIEGELQDRDN